MAHEGLVSRLLSRRNRLSRVEKDAILECVLAEVAPASRRRRTAWLVAGLGLAAAAGLLLVLPRLSPSPGRADETFTARGGGAPSAFRAHCGDTGCRAGAKLVFEISEGAADRYFAAFARRADGTILWYFPETAAGTSKDLSRDLERGVVTTGIVLGAEHPPGSYEVYGVFSRRPLDRPAVKALIGGTAAASSPTGAVVTQKVTIE